MSGETEAQVSGWSVDTLHTHLLRELAALDRIVQQRFTDRGIDVDRRIDDLSNRIAATMQANSDLLDERYQTQQRQVDAAFLAQSTAMATALTAAERANAASREATALAINKAEASTEKRFEAVNEFRGQLADQSATLVARNEMNVVVNALTDRLNLLQASLSKLELQVTARLENTKGERDGSKAAINGLYALAGFIAVVIGIGVTIFAFRTTGGAP